MEILAVVPTYNEAGNIEQLTKELLSLPLLIEVLVVDDLSPDHTYQIVENLAKSNPKIHLLLRKENRGRGLAGIDGFKKALEMGAKYVVEMDADLSHSPKYIADFMKKIPEAGIVSGSRYLEGGKDEKRSFARKLISSFARKYLSFILGIRLSDPTSGFRLFRREALEKIVPFLKAKDPFIVTEVFFYAKKLGITVREVPIEFYSRASGESKLKITTLIKYLIRVWKLKFSHEPIKP